MTLDSGQGQTKVIITIVCRIDTRHRVIIVPTWLVLVPRWEISLLRFTPLYSAMPIRILASVAMLVWGRYDGGLASIAMKFFEVKRVSVKKKVWRVSWPVAAPLDIWTFQNNAVWRVA